MKKPAIRFIRFYQKNISAYTTPKCKYYPTCSHYAVEALETHGFVKGSLLSVWRILRCNPFSKGGYDPVPEKKKKKRGNS
jgi:putative membrane protein insertion efficiency factor